MGTIEGLIDDEVITESDRKIKTHLDRIKTAGNQTKKRKKYL